jgi:hypothetical protein
MAGTNNSAFTDSIPTKAGMLYGKKVDSFYSFSGVQLQVKERLLLDQQKRIRATIILKDDLHFNIDLSSQSLTRPGIIIFDKHNVIFNSLLSFSLTDKLNYFNAISDSVIHLAPGIYNCRIYIQSCLNGSPSLNSTNIKLEVK